jgi:DNA gyrase subunit A
MDVLPASPSEALPVPPEADEENVEVAADELVAEESVVDEAVAEESEESEDEVALAADDRGFILTITEKGFGKRTPVTSYRLQRRGGLGLSNLKVTDKNGKVASIAHVGVDEQILLITEQGMMIRTDVESIRIAGRKTQGVRVINISDDDTVVAAVKLIEREQPEDNGGGEDGSEGDGAVDETSSEQDPSSDDEAVH